MTKPPITYDQAKSALQKGQRTYEKVLVTNFLAQEQEIKNELIAACESVLREGVSLKFTSTIAKAKGEQENKPLEDMAMNEDHQPIPLSCFWRNKKTGVTYWAFGLATNKTNAQDGEPLILYRDETQTYARKAQEFIEKCERVVD